ncbi:hypothetical protein AQPE_0891 [Aquipluma nitroreducens]|uniref:Uncharacterized protein n=2 Tax=Aquipluma nitroreducens TaxID=2010828 RepID=A0A5K7S5G9_9BACT|nr:hypothetical protein AQPE_0891 [Aquipluma nitroreducens]
MLAFVLPFASCNDEETIESKTVVLETDFNKVASSNPPDGWSAVFAEYPDGKNEFYELNSGIKNLPQPLDQAKKAFMLSGNNHSDALQMWLVKQLSGLSPESKYSIETEIELASKYPGGSVGIGGSPGNAVHLVSKFATQGYTLEKGKTEGDNIQLVLKKVEAVPESVLNIDLGDVAITSDQYVYKLITRKKSSDTNTAVTDKDGKLWAIVGTWSGFEGISTLYYTRIKFTLTKT